MPYFDFLKNKRVVMTLLAYSTTALIITYYDPILSLRLTEIGVDESDAGLAFSLMTSMFAVSSAAIGYLSEKIDRRIIMTICVNFIVASIYMTGLDSITTVYFGLALNGVFIGGIFAPILPEIIATME